MTRVTWVVPRWVEGLNEGLDVFTRACQMIAGGGIEATFNG